ncbi:MAG TPA: RsmE family RNA methyltransferase [bacterium]|jgi:16S rRNA (uracil1498-N3)-methyltransferase|nr:RsmE family RNA methyltransferase [bacterium]
MHRIAVPSEVVAGGEVVLPPAQAHHVANVLRMRPGERIVLFDGRGTDYDVELTVVGRGEVRGVVVDRRTRERPRLRLMLVQAVPKGAKMDLIVRMGTEVGVDAFVPVLTRRAIAAPAPARLQRWRRLAAAAAAQSGRSAVPGVETPRPFAEVWPLLTGSLILMPWEGEHTHSIAAALAAAPSGSSVALLIGPEGGWDPDEVEAARTHGAQVVSLGPLTLRTETAGVVAAAMVLYELTLRHGPTIGPGRA